jgi:hypothetical protein
VIVPLPDIAPVWSAAGAANADIVHVYLESRVLSLPVEPGVIEQSFRPLTDRARLALEEDGFTSDSMLLSRASR